MTTLYLVDDHAIVREGLRAVLEAAAFEVVGDLLNPGPTLTNVSDFRVVLVDIAKA